jgi:hypothetical protein
MSFMLRLRGIVDRPNQLVDVDETAKDCNASRHQCAWRGRGHRTGKVRLFNGIVHYTLIAACNMNGFVFPACDIVLREATDDFSGAVDTEYWDPLRWSDC